MGQRDTKWFISAAVEKASEPGTPTALPSCHSSGEQACSNRDIWQSCDDCVCETNAGGWWEGGEVSSVCFRDLQEGHPSPVVWSLLMQALVAVTFHCL